MSNIIQREDHQVKARVDGLDISDDKSLKSNLGVYGTDLSRESTNEDTDRLNEEKPSHVNLRAKDLETSELSRSPLQYLLKYGYIEVAAEHTLTDLLNSENPDIDEEIIIKAIDEFQRFNNLPVTGVLDDKTLGFMKEPRCGDKDEVFETNNSNLVKRFDPVTKWSKLLSLQDKVLKYWFDFDRFPSSNSMSKNDAKAAVEAGMQLWADHAPISFVEVESKDESNILLSWEPKKHEKTCGTGTFDTELAHATYPWELKPVYIHFNKDKTGSSTYYLTALAAHELGHTLGLGHSDVEPSIMEPIIKTLPYGKGLHADDIAAIQYTYSVGAGKVYPIGVTVKLGADGRCQCPAEFPVATDDGEKCTNLCSYNGDCIRNSITVMSSLTPCSNFPGGWSDWSIWSVCDKKCAGGTRSRTRVCVQPIPPATGTADCYGEAIDEKVCNDHPCYSKYRSKYCTEYIDLFANSKIVLNR